MEKLVIWLAFTILLSFIALLFSEAIKQKTVTLDIFGAILGGREIFLVFATIAADGMGSNLIARHNATVNYQKVWATVCFAGLFILFCVMVFMFCFVSGEEVGLLPMLLMFLGILTCCYPGKVSS